VSNGEQAVSGEFLNWLIPATYATSALTGFRPVPRVRILPSPPRSLNCRENLSRRLKYAINAGFRRLFADKPDCTERTARHVGHGFTGFSLDPQPAVRLSSSMRRTPGDHKPMIRRSRLEFPKPQFREFCAQTGRKVPVLLRGRGLRPLSLKAVWRSGFKDCSTDATRSKPMTRRRRLDFCPHLKPFLRRFCRHGFAAWLSNSAIVIDFQERCDG